MKHTIKGVAFWSLMLAGLVIGLGFGEKLGNELVAKLSTQPTTTS